MGLSCYRRYTIHIIENRGVYLFCQFYRESFIIQGNTVAIREVEEVQGGGEHDFDRPVS